MGDVSNEPSMEHILSSIKRIIAEDGDAQIADRRDRRPARAAANGRSLPREDATQDVLELSDAMPEDTMPPAPPPQTADEEIEGEEGLQPVPPLASPDTVAASKTSLNALSRLIVRPEAAGSDTLEGLVRDMLKPMLAEWLDENLPRVVDTLVAREIARITGR